VAPKAFSVSTNVLTYLIGAILNAYLSPRFRAKVGHGQGRNAEARSQMRVLDRFAHNGEFHGGLHSFGARILGYIGFFLIYFILYRSSYTLQTSELLATPWNPEAGIAVIAGAMLGWASIPAIFLANLLNSQFLGPSLSLKWELTAAAANTLVLCGAGKLAQKTLMALKQPTVMQFSLFLCFAVATTIMLIAAKVAITAYRVQIDIGFLFPYILTLTVGNLVGIITITPLPFIWESWRDAVRYIRGWSVQQWAILAVLIGMSFVVFGLKETDEFKVFYLIFLPVIAFAVKDGLEGAAASVLLSSIAMIAILYWRDYEPSTVAELQFLMIALAGTGLILGASISEKKRVSAALQESHLRLRSAQNSLLQASRISLASEMTAALAHELNQPLASIRNFVRSVRRKLDLPRFEKRKLIPDIDAAVKQVDAAAELIRQTRRFLERGEVSMEPIDLANLANTSVDMVRPELQKAGITLRIQAPRSKLSVLGNEPQLQQVILNLLRNAKEAISEAASSERIIEVVVLEMTRPGHVEVAISDSGSGVSEDIRPLLFQPLTSSKPHALGLGLSLCNTIIRNHGGEIWHDPVGATRFAFTLPLHREAH
jgi:signal transduction histidine kinase